MNIPTHAARGPDLEKMMAIDLVDDFTRDLDRSIKPGANKFAQIDRSSEDSKAKNLSQLVREKVELA